MKKIGLLFSIIILGFSSAAQQVPSYAQYFVNPFLFNPAAAGHSDDTRIFSTFRNQWVGIPGAPETQALTIDGKIPDSRVALGLTLYHDSDNILSRTGGLGTYAYHLPLGSDHSVSMGISFGFIRSQIDFDKLRAENMADQALLQSVNYGTGYDGSAGLSYAYKKFRIGIAALQLFQNNVTFAAEPDKSIAFKLIRHYQLTAQYPFVLHPDKLKLEPLVLLRSAQGLPTQVDMNLVATFHKNYWLAIGHKLNTSIGMALGMKLHNRLTVGYSYEYTTNSLARYQNGSHEVMVGYTLQRNRSRDYNPGTTESYDRSGNQNQALYETIDQVNQQNEKLANDLKEQKQIVQSQKSEIDRLRELIAYTSRERDSVVLASRVNVHTEDFESNSDADYYVVVGAFELLRNAKQFQQILRRELSLSTSMIQKPNGLYYFVYTKKISNRREALAEMNRLRNLNSDLFDGEPWVYKKL